MKRASRCRNFTTMVCDIRASRPDVVISMIVGARWCGDFTGPQLVGEGHSESIFMALLEVANDAVAEGRKDSAMDVLRELVEKRADATRMLLLRPLIIPVRQTWGFMVKLCDGAEPGPVDIWFRCLLTRDVA